MMIEQIPDYSALNKPPYFLEFMIGGDVEQIAVACDHQFNDLELAAFGVMTGIWLNSASGVQLDILGKHLNLLRNGREDASYATLLKVAAFIYLSSGQPDTLIRAIKALYGATSAALVADYPMKVIINQNGALALFLIETYLLENGDTYVLDNGDTYQFNIEDTSAEAVLQGAVAAGVKLTVNKV